MKPKYTKIYGLKVGEIVSIPFATPEEQHSIVASVSQYGKDNNKKFTTKTETKGMLRVSRIK